VQVITGGIYATQGGGSDAPFLEILADNAVVFLREKAAASFLGQLDNPTSQPTEAGSEPSETPGGVIDRDESLGGLDESSAPAASITTSSATGP
jgi:hypothetical protein